MGLQVGVGLLRARADLDQALVRGAAGPGGRPLPHGVSGRGADLVQVHREEIEVLVGLGEVDAAVAHVGARLGGGQLDVLAREPAAEVDRDPRAVAVAADAHDVSRDVVDVPGTPVL